MKQLNQGFTLIELMIVVAIIGILASIAVPAYQDYTVRSKITEGLVLGTSAKTRVLDGYMSNDIVGVASSSTAFSASFTPTKYVNNIVINPADGMITITYNIANVGQITLATNTVTLTPSIGNAILVANMAAGGNIDWACASATSVTATLRGLPVTVPGTIASRFVPTECK